MKRQWRHLGMRALFGGLIGLSITLAACGGTSPALSTAASASTAAASGAAPAKPIAAKAGGTVNFRLIGQVDTLDPPKTGSGAAAFIGQALYDRLVTIDKDGKLAPYLAQSWTVTPTAVTMKMRTDATCSDGTKVTPSVAAASLNRLEDPATKAPLTVAARYGRKLTATGDDGNATLNIALDKPFGGLILQLALPQASIICPGGLKDQSLLLKQAFGSGPYTLESIVPGTVTVTARPDYKWGPSNMTTQDAGVPAKFVFLEIPNETTAVNEMIAGQVSVTQALGPDGQRLLSDSSLFHTSAFTPANRPIVFNQNDGHVTQDKAVRTALAMAIDRDAVNKIAFNGKARNPASYLTPLQACYDPSAQQTMSKFDTAAAKTTLQQAGWTAGSDGKLSKAGKPLTLKVMGHDALKGELQYATQAFNNLGANASISIVDGGAYLDQMNKGGDWDISSIAWTGDPTAEYNTPYLTDNLGPAFSKNWSHIEDADLSKALDTGINTSGDDACKAYSTAQNLVNKNVDLLPVANPSIDWFGKGVVFTTINANLIDVLSIRVAA